MLPRWRQSRSQVNQRSMSPSTGPGHAACVIMRLHSTQQQSLSKLGQHSCSFQSLLGSKHRPRRFAKIFSTAPAWLLQFTRTVLDAWIIRFRLAEMKPNPNWGTAGFADAEHWPLLPNGVLTAGEPIPHHDARHIILVMQSIVPPIDRIPKNVDLFAPKDDPSHEGGTILDDIDFAVSLNEKPEWSAYERRRMRKILRRLSRDDWSDHIL